MINDDISPRQHAYRLMLDALRALHDSVAPSSSGGYSTGESRRIRNQIAATHNRLLDKSVLDGLHISTEEK